MNRKNKRLLDLVVSLGYDAAKARGIILAGKVFVSGVKETRPGILIPVDAELAVEEESKYVSRAAYKLLGALDDFSLTVKDRICLDIGSSHGGFTQVLLEKEAKSVYSVDVGYGVLDFSLRKDAKVHVLERRNIRDLEADWFEKSDMVSLEDETLFVVCDVSFISLKTVLNSLLEFSKKNHINLEGLFLLKPQFENSKATDKGIIRDEALREKILSDMLKFSENIGYKCEGNTPARLKGTQGNQEYVLYLSLHG